jgi:hypothetical protein
VLEQRKLWELVPADGKLVKRPQHQPHVPFRLLQEARVSELLESLAAPEVVGDLDAADALLLGVLVDLLLVALALPDLVRVHAELLHRRLALEQLQPLVVDLHAYGHPLVVFRLLKI